MQKEQCEDKEGGGDFEEQNIRLFQTIKCRCTRIDLFQEPYSELHSSANLRSVKSAEDFRSRLMSLDSRASSIHSQLSSSLGRLDLDEFSQ